MEGMLLAQISDVHVRPEGVLYKDVADSNRMFAEAIQHVNRLDPRPDLLLITGDLVDEGRPEEYSALRIRLEQCEVPYLVMPGNHDRRETLRDAFLDHRYLPPATRPLHYTIDDYPVRIVALDTTVPGKHHGEVTSEGLKWLAQTLAAEPHKPTVVLMHHPPFVSGIPYLDAYRCMATEGLAGVLSRFTNIERVLCGHVHRPMQMRWAGTLVCACPSTATQIALRLKPDATPASFLEPPACLLHRWDPKAGMVTHTSYIGEFAGPFAFF